MTQQTHEQLEDIDKTHAILAYGMCSGCNDVPGTPEHLCPYAEDIHNDHDSECNCCNRCVYQCCMDI